MPHAYLLCHIFVLNACVALYSQPQHQPYLSSMFAALSSCTFEPYSYLYLSRIYLDFCLLAYWNCKSCCTFRPNSTTIGLSHLCRLLSWTICLHITSSAVQLAVALYSCLPSPWQIGVRLWQIGVKTSSYLPKFPISLCSLQLNWCKYFQYRAYTQCPACYLHSQVKTVPNTIPNTGISCIILTHSHS